MRPKVFIILGPTATGKSEVALELATTLNADILNADSQQVYRHMDIGTGKPSAAERKRVAHHLIDIIDPDEEFNVAVFRRLAMQAIGAVRERDGKVIVCGGTGLYLKALTRGLFVGPEPSGELREELAREIEEKGLGYVYSRLMRVDPATDSRIHPHDRQRIIRALEVYELTGRPMSQWQEEHQFRDEPFETLKIGLGRERAELYEQIHQRVERMVAEGFVEEVRALATKGYSLDLKPLQSIGYRQIGALVRGRMTLEEAVEDIKRETRHLAKRQLTWFRRDEEVHWYHPERDRGNIAKAAKDFFG